MTFSFYTRIISEGRGKLVNFPICTVDFSNPKDEKGDSDRFTKAKIFRQGSSSYAKASEDKNLPNSIA